MKIIPYQQIYFYEFPSELYYIVSVLRVVGIPDTDTDQDGGYNKGTSFQEMSYANRNMLEGNQKLRLIQLDLNRFQ